MTNFAKLNDHEEKMFNIWLQFWADCYDGYYDDRDEDFGFEEYLEEMIEEYSQDCYLAGAADEYIQCLAEWRA